MERGQKSQPKPSRYVHDLLLRLAHATCNAARTSEVQAHGKNAADAMELL
jgi:hypothetical protein